MAARDVLLDTGPVVASLDRSDQWHDNVADTWSALADRCLTTEAVLTEACHLVAGAGAGGALALEFLLAAQIPILGLDPPLHRHASRLMRRYADTPMDYADATLVTLAEALELTEVFTLDRKGFSTYRSGRRRFRILPEG